VTIATDAADVDPYIGQLFAGSFEIKERVGTGSMGVVYLAEQISLNKKVAIKILKATMAQNAEVLQRFEREARAASRLNHPNSISVIDFGQSEDGSPYIAMEYIDGRDLGQMLSDEFPLDHERLLKFMVQVCSALDEAHAAGIIHRDLKPANIVVAKRRSGEEYVKVLDFGIAKINDTEGGTKQLTQDGLICGTPAFMSPEQIKGMPLDPRSDIYALGVVLFMLLTNRLPFQANSSAAMAAKIITETPPRVSKVRLDLKIPAHFDDVVARAMAKDREERYESAIQLRQDLEDALDRLKNPVHDEPERVHVGAYAPAAAPRYAAPGAPPPPRATGPRTGGFPAPPAAALIAPLPPPAAAAAARKKKKDAAPRRKAAGGEISPEVMSTTMMSDDIPMPRQEATRIGMSAMSTTPEEPIRVSRGAGFWIALLLVVVLLLGSAAGAYYYVAVLGGDIAIADTGQPTVDIEARAAAITRAVGKARYHVNLAQVGAESQLQKAPTDGDDPDNAAPDDKDDRRRRAEDKRRRRTDGAEDVAPPDPDKDRVKGDTPNGKVPPADDTPPPADDAPAGKSRADQANEEYKLGQDTMSSDSQAAMRHFEKATRLNPRHRSAWLGIHRIAVRLGNDKQARSACLRIIALSRTDDFAKSSCEKWLKRNGHGN